MKTKPAQGLTGFIIETVYGLNVFRVYRGDHSFTDYELRHGDLEVMIVDKDAVLYELDDGENMLDHSPETLGIDDG